jgi:two-component system, OmpR family, sensor histidine kinase KdpD
MKVYRLSKRGQYLLSIGVVCSIVLIGTAVHDLVGYRVIAFVLLLGVSGVALFVDIRPVIVAALLSALAWDYLFIPPRFTFTVGATEDRILLATYFIVVVVHAVLTYRIREMQQEIRRKEAKANAVKFYNTLLNSLSHELRTPITTIIGATDNLQSNGGRISESDKKELLSEISIASERLNQQVENLLNMSRLESGVFEIRKDWVDVKELVYTVLRRFDSGIAKRPVHVFIHEDIPLFKLDFGLMEQILHNLITNVIQHTPEGTEMTIAADCRDEKLILSISDTGPGFPQADIQKVFDKFYRVKGSKAGGTGLGLSIVKGFVEAHHGTVVLRNLPLLGAELSVEIPTEVSYLSGLKNE